jgi:predicted Fe-S protein YdhL (DUF1289 family)
LSVHDEAPTGEAWHLQQEFRSQQPDPELQRLIDTLAACTSREQLATELERALARVRQLGGPLRICAGCKKIRDEAGSWHPIEAYLQQHSALRFTHTMCPDCVRRLYPELSQAVLEEAGDAPQASPAD